MKRQKTKQEKIKKKDKRNASPEPVVRDWQPLFAAFRDITDWALDIAVALSRDIPEDVDSIEEVRSFVHAWLDGSPCDFPLTDVLITLGTIFAAIEIDLGIDSASLLSPLREVADKPSRRNLRVRRVAHDHESTARILRLCDELAARFTA